MLFYFVLIYMEKTCLYIISNGDGAIKVGVSKNPTKRVKQLQTGNENRLELLFYEEFECPREKVFKVEHMVHRELRNRCQKRVGEWFYLDNLSLEQVKNTIIWYRIRYDN